MSFIYRDRKDEDFSYGSTFCPYRDVCTVRRCSVCRVFENERDNLNEIWRESKHEKSIK